MKVILKVVGGLVLCLMGGLSCVKTPTHSIFVNTYIGSDFVGDTVTNDHEKYFVARSDEALTNWLSGKLLDSSKLQEFRNIDYSQQVAVICVGARLSTVKRIPGDVVVLTVVPQNIKGVGLAVVQGKTNVFFKFN